MKKPKRISFRDKSYLKRIVDEIQSDQNEKFLKMKGEFDACQPYKKRLEFWVSKGFDLLNTKKEQNGIFISIKPIGQTQEIEYRLFLFSHYLKTNRDCNIENLKAEFEKKEKIILSPKEYIKNGINNISSRFKAHECLSDDSFFSRAYIAGFNFAKEREKISLLVYKPENIKDIAQGYADAKYSAYLEKKLESFGDKTEQHLPEYTLPEKLLILTYVLDITIGLEKNATLENAYKVYGLLLNVDFTQIKSTLQDIHPLKKHAGLSEKTVQKGKVQIAKFKRVRKFFVRIGNKVIIKDIDAKINRIEELCKI